MGKKMFYGTNEIELSQEADLTDLQLKIHGFLTRAKPGWLDVNALNGEASVLIAPGIPVMLTETVDHEPAPPQAF